MVPEPVEGLNERYTHYFWDSLFNFYNNARFHQALDYNVPKGKTCPVFIFLHSYTNALEGEVCINYFGAEFFAKEDYQKSFGGAYILVPLANEKRNEEGEVVDSWSETYANLLYNLINEFNDEEVAMS